MFHFPTFPPNALCVQAPVAGHDSSWVSPFGDPRITARLPTPRGLSQAPTTFFGSWCQGIHHVPLVACHYKRLLMLASTMQFSRNGRYRLRDHRVAAAAARSVRSGPRGSAQRLDPSGPNNVPGTRPPRSSRFHSGKAGSTDEVPCGRVPNNRRSTSEHHRVETFARPTMFWMPAKPAPEMLLRKEVIQPHLPVRLPCYDLVPIASPTFDGSLPKGLGHRLRVLPTFVT
jgi:hypothetical protein